MSRAIIGGIIPALILVFTAVAYFVTTSNLEQKLRKETRSRVARSQQQLGQNAALEGLGLLKRVEALATDQAFVKAMQAAGKERTQVANLAFRRFMQELDPDESKPDILALTDATGDLVAMLDVPNPLPKVWKHGEELKYPALALALSRQQFTSEIWNYENEGLMKVGIAPIIDTDEDVVLGALVVAYAMTSREARKQSDLLGANVAYFYGDGIYATSFTRGAGEEDTEMQSKLAIALAEDGLGKTALDQGSAGRVSSVSINGAEYLATAVRLPRFSSKPLPESYPGSMAGALVMMSVAEALAPTGTLKMAVLLLGVAAFVLAVLATILTTKRILSQADEIEDAINDITNGNLDRSVRPVGADLDGLAHALNVMLARLLGRPEPGEEEYDDQGNLIHASQVNFDNDELANLSPADPATMALAEEAEPEYYNRLFNEYIKAREQVGDSTSATNYENFVAKLRLNESNLKVKYQCSAVRFKVVVKDDKVTLKPVPIV